MQIKLVKIEPVAALWNLQVVQDVLDMLPGPSFEDTQQLPASLRGLQRCNILLSSVADPDPYNFAGSVSKLGWIRIQQKPMKTDKSQLRTKILLFQFAW